MRLAAPVSHPDEVEMLVSSGADELYCGLVPADWTTRHGAAVAVNRRGPLSGNLTAWRQLRDLVDDAHQRGAPVHLTVNAPAYGSNQLADVRRLAIDAVEQAGVDALIVADVGLLASLAEHRPGLRVHVSSLAAVHNAQAAMFFRDIGAARIILPRQTSIREAVAIAAAAPDVEIETFVLNDGCAFEEGLCSTLHEAGPICLVDWTYRAHAAEGGTPDAAGDATTLARVAGEYRDWISAQVGVPGTLTPTGMPSGPCGLCAIPDLCAGGIRSLKIAGRQMSAFGKLRSVQQARAILDRVESGDPAEACRAAARALRGTPDLCASSRACYYPGTA